MKYASKSEKFNSKLDLNNLSIVDNCKSYLKTQRYAKNFLSHNLIPSDTYEIKNTNDIIKFLPETVVEYEVPTVLYIELKSEFQEIALLPPHIDIKRTVAINYYFETNSERTSFYDYNKLTQEVNEVESFTSKNNEIWILNVSVPHSVTFFRPYLRKFLSFSFNKLTYDKLVSMLC